MNFSTRRISANVFVGGMFLAAVSAFAYFGIGVISSQVAQVSSGLVEQGSAGYDTPVKFSTGYSSTQGRNNWSYQYRVDSDEVFRPDVPGLFDLQSASSVAVPTMLDSQTAIGGYSNMSWTNNRWEAPGTYPLFRKGFFHPGPRHEAVLKWTAPKAGEIKITGTASDNDGTGGDGVKARIFKEGTQLWTSGVIRNGDSTGKSHDVITSVTAGQAIYFIVDNNSVAGDHYYDTTKWDPSIAYKKTTTPPDGGPGIVKGSITAVGKDADGTFIEGWACHENVDQAITLDIYVGAAKGAAGSVFVVKTPATNIASPANIHTACDTAATVAHNFKYYLTPAAATAHAGKKLYLYGNSTTGAAGDKLLGRSGQVNLPTVTPPQTSVVKGNITSAGKDASGTFVEGWACQVGVDQSITVDIYVGAGKGAAGSTFVIKTPATNLDSSSAVHSACDTPNTIKHNFKYYFTPAAATTHAGKKLYLYGNSTTGAAGDKILARSGSVSLPNVVDISNKFSVSNPVRTTDNVIVRNIPNGASLGQQAQNARGVIAAPSSSQNGIKAGSYYWWYTNFNTGVDGWVAEPNLALASSTPSTGVVKGAITNLRTDSTGTFVEGWACHERVNQAIALDIYAGGVKGTGTFVVTTPPTNLNSNATTRVACGTSNTVKHHFKYYFTQAALATYGGQTIHIYGKSTSSSTPDALLTRSGQFSLPQASGAVKGTITSVGEDTTGIFVQGWACQYGVDESITIDIYAGGPKGAATSTLVVKTPRTNIDSPAAIHTACDTPNSVKHNFKYYFTSAAATAHAGKKLYLYGNSTTGAAGDRLLGRSGDFALPNDDDELSMRLLPATDELVWDGVFNCVIPDGPFNMWKNNIGETFAALPLQFNHSLKSNVLGGEFEISPSQTARRTFTSPQQRTEKYYDSGMWMFGYWTENGRDVYAIAHHEWYHPDHQYIFTGNPSQNCANFGTNLGGRNRNNGVHHLTSNDGGLNFRTTVPVDTSAATNRDRMVLAPELYGTKLVGAQSTTRYGFFHPSNIVKEGDYYYFTVALLETLLDQSGNPVVPNRDGLMLVRTNDISKPMDGSTYQFWNGDNWTNITAANLEIGEPFIFTHKSGIANSEKVKGSPAAISPMSFSLKWNPEHSQWIIFGHTFPRKLSYFTTPSLANPDLSSLKDVENSEYQGANSGWFASYPTLVDPTSAGYVFQEVKDDVYLYYVNWRSGGPYSRDIRRMRVEIE